MPGAGLSCHSVMAVMEGNWSWPRVTACMQHPQPGWLSINVLHASNCRAWPWQDEGQPPSCGTLYCITLEPPHTTPVAWQTCKTFHFSQCDDAAFTGPVHAAREVHRHSSPPAPSACGSSAGHSNTRWNRCCAAAPEESCKDR